ncbi:ABC transporter related protein [Caldicellulosiruptor kronotskyensis 2002]|uniref:ABC transporter related protein n=2 Tax=Caldicellulosiruptor TaxID=44000 RepID=E4SD45_CALK2|nr:MULTISPECIES: ABC transporter ATP-binding protein [Caldicellulosiruptor]ADQ41823.1 ABC transporter related protein [Caldicellulosiruptor acetigenus I77R1B]ADQ45109.1 ABC transporter related protein [Caldicellulosiruptor kronotskyensis 2002]
MIELYNISKIYKMGDNEVYALNGVTLKIQKNEFVAILGPSGSGKSTLMNIIGCLDTPTSGSYILDGNEVSKLSDNQLAEIRNSKIGFVFQQFNLIPQLTALENVELPLIYQGVSASKRHKLAKEALEKVGLGDRLHHRPRQLSGGQQQRVAIARALVTSPSIILADEPTGNLDSKSGSEIMQIFKQLHSQGSTIVLITHDNNIASQAKRIVRIHDGQIVEDTCLTYIF